MGYPSLKESNGNSAPLTPFKRLRFWNFQWKAMQDDLIKFYSKKE
jgi:hypothetical protein